MKNNSLFKQTMNIKDKSVLEMLNKLIAINRLNNRQILQMVNLVSLSIDINDLKDNLKWESPKTLNWISQRIDYVLYLVISRNSRIDKEIN